MATVTPYKHDDLPIILECAKSHLNTIAFIRAQSQAFINKQSCDLYQSIDAIEGGDIASKPMNAKMFTLLQKSSELANDAYVAESEIRLRLAVLAVGGLSLNAFESESSVMKEARALESLAIETISGLAVGWVEFQRHLALFTANH
jgi:hypothetical protein